jgi:steroid delta-isomerase-like uncharacterized protein
MSAQENKAMVHRIEEAVAKGDLEALDDLYAADVVDHNPFPEQAPGLEGLKQKVSALNEAFPDQKLSVDFLVAEGDTVVDHWTASSTHRGELMGISPSNNEVVVTGISIYRFKGGKVAEEWTEFDGIGMLAQMGALPE